MTKGRPKINLKVAEFMNLAVTQHPDWTAGDVLRAVRNKFESKGIPIPKLRTAQQYIKIFRRKLIEEEPWSLATMESNNDIPWEAVPFLMECYIELIERAEQGEQLWPWGEQLLGDLKKSGLEVRQSESQKEIVLTHRQAKWLWRLHFIFPKLKLIDLLRHVDTYVHREMVADYLGWDFDTSDLDGSLLNTMRDIKKHGYYPDRSQSNEIGKEDNT